VDLLRYGVKCTVTNSPFNIQASCSKCSPSAWIPFLTLLTRELLTLRSTVVLHNVRSSLVTRVRKGIQADGGHSEQLARMLNGESATVHLTTYLNKCTMLHFFLIYLL
jgi:hypothetical protein